MILVALLVMLGITWGLIALGALVTTPEGLLILAAVALVSGLGRWWTCRGARSSSR